MVFLLHESNQTTPELGGPSISFKVFFTKNVYKFLVFAYFHKLRCVFLGGKVLSRLFIRAVKICFKKKRVRCLFCLVLRCF